MSREDFNSFIPADKTIPELTLKAVLVGMVLAVIMGSANAYLGLYAGMTVSAAIPGAIMGGYLLGLAEVLFVGLLPPIYSAYRDAFVFSTLILILLFLPNGLLGKRMEDRA